MLEERRATLQILVDKNTLLYNGTGVSASQEQFDSVIEELPQDISNSKDKLVSFTYYDEDNFYAEKIKTYYDFRLKSERKHAYNPNYNKEQASLIYEKFIVFFEELREQYLRSKKDEIITMIDQGFKATSKSLQVLRNDLLEKSDWTQIPDNNMPEDIRELWKQYRQYLRDITQDFTWETSNVFDMQFPIDPSTYLLRYPNREIAYLSSQDQFENQLAAKAKARLLGFIDYLRLPSMGRDESLKYHSYKDIQYFVNKKLAKIDPNLEITITSRRIPDDPVNTMGLQSGYTPEMFNLLKSILEDPNLTLKYTEQEIVNFRNYVEGYTEAILVINSLETT